MMQRGIITFAAALFLSLGVSAAVMAQSQRESDANSPILFTADRLVYDRDVGMVTASGHVEASRDDNILLADTVSYNERDNIVTASGNVSLTDPKGDVIFAEFMELSGDFRDGVIRQIRLRMADNSRIAAAGARRSNGNTTDMRNGAYTPCNQCANDPEATPLWQLKAKQVVHDQEEQTVEYRDVWMEFLGVPVAYTPYLSHPDPTVRRQTGFLAPTMGLSSYFGPHASTPYFWNIAPNRDLTLTPTVTDRENAILAGEYRGLEEKSKIDAKISGTVDANNKFRGNIDSIMQHNVDESWRWGAAIERSTDDTYLRRYGYQSPSRALTSNLNAETFRVRDYASANAYAFQGLQEHDVPGQIPIVAPLLQYNHVGFPDEIGQRTSLTASLLSMTRTEGNDTRRLSVEGGYHIPYYGPYGSVFNLDATLRGDGYYVNKLTLPGPNPSDRETGVEGRIYPELGLGWKLPMTRPHDNGINEILEPQATFYASPAGGNTSKIPNEDSQDFEFDDLNLFSPNRFTGIDRVEGGERVSYGVKWGVFGPSGGGTDVFFGQSYRFTGDDTFSPGSGLDEGLSDYVGRVDVYPGRDIALTYRTRIDKDNFEQKRSEVQTTIGPPSLYSSVGYSFFDNRSDLALPVREELSAGLTGKISRYWRGSIAGTRDLEQNEMRTMAANLTYECECFVFDVTLRRNFFEDRDLKPDDSILFRLTFKTLGDVQSSASLNGL